MTGMVTNLAVVALAALLADAALSDLRGLRIPNRDPILVLVVFLVCAGFLLDPGLIVLHLAAAVLLFLAGTVLFSLGVWGGGDVKLVAALGLWTGFAGMPRFLAVMALAGGVLALLLLAARGVAALTPAAAGAWRQRLMQSTHLPYGIAIGAAGLDWLAQAGLAG